MTLKYQFVLLLVSFLLEVSGLRNGNGNCSDKSFSEVKQELSETKEHVQELKSLLHQYQQKTDALQSLMERLEMSTLGKEISKRVQEISSPTRTQIAFYAQLTHDQTHIGDHQPFVFDGVRTNIGNAYNKDDGIFTAPTTGVYVFFWTTAAPDSTHMQSELVVNGVQYGRVWADSGDHIDFSFASNTVVVSLQKGNTVWIRSDTYHSTITEGQNYSTFSGWLLWTM